MDDVHKLSRLFVPVLAAWIVIGIGLVILADSVASTVWFSGGLGLAVGVIRRMGVMARNSVD